MRRPSHALRRRGVAGAAAVVVLASGCGNSPTPKPHVATTEAPAKRSAVGQKFAACLEHAGVVVTHSARRVAFLRGTSLYGKDPSAGTDVVSVGGRHAAVSFEPESGGADWRLYTLSAVTGAEADEPPYETIWRAAIMNPAALEVVGIDQSGSAKTERCMSIVSGF